MLRRALSAQSRQCHSLERGIGRVIIVVESVESAENAAAVVVAVEAVRFEFRCVIRHPVDHLFELHLMRFDVEREAERESRCLGAGVNTRNVSRRRRRRQWLWNQKPRENNHHSICSASKNISR